MRPLAIRTVGRRPGRPRTQPQGSKGNRTLQRGIEVLKTIAQLSGPCTLSEIARAAAMSPSRAFRYLEALVESHFIHYESATGAYSLGLGALDLGAAAISKVDPAQITSRLLRELTETTRLASHISVWGSNGPTVIRSEAGSLETALRIREGHVLGLLTTSAGQIFLAFADEAGVEQLLRRDLTEWNRKVPQARRFNRAALQALRKSIRESGISCAIGMRNPNVAALSAPVFDRNGLIMSITVSGIEGSFDSGLESEAARDLKDAAELMTRYLGGLYPRTGKL